MTVVPKPVAEDKIEDFIALYRRLRANRGDRILARQDMSMREVAGFAADMTIVEMIDDDRWIVRLNGTRHCSQANIDRTGANVLEACSPDERALRREIAKQMFDYPCGLFAGLRQVYDDGSNTMMDTASLPLLGKDGEKLILTYGLLVEDLDQTFLNRPVMESIGLTAHRFVDLGFGVPG